MAQEATTRPVPFAAARSVRAAGTAGGAAVAGAVVLAIGLGVLALTLAADRSGEQIAAAVLWMKYAAVVGLYWTFALVALGSGAAALRLAGAGEGGAVTLREACKDRFARTASLLGDLNLAVLFESLIVFFLLGCWTVFSFHPAALVCWILTPLGAAGHWLATVAIQDHLADRVERA